MGTGGTSECSSILLASAEPIPSTTTTTTECVDDSSHIVVKNKKKEEIMLCDWVANQTKRGKYKKKQLKLCNKIITNNKKFHNVGKVSGQTVKDQCPCACNTKEEEEEQQDANNEDTDTNTDGEPNQSGVLPESVFCPTMTNQYPVMELNGALCLDDDEEGLYKYEDGQQCEYDYVYTGCTWEELQCSKPTKICTCNSPLYKDFKWMCEMDTIQTCADANNSG